MGPTKRSGPIKPGSATFASDGAITITGYGTGSAGKRPAESADSLYFLFKTIDGDGEVVAKVASSMPMGDETIELGVMARADLDGYGNFISFEVDSGGKAVERHYRASLTEGGAVGSGQRVMGLPLYLKLTREGNVFRGAYSTDGVTWKQHEQRTLTWPRAVNLGIYVASGWGRENAPTLARFESVSIKPR
jgi:hypothetical protein